MTFNTPDAVKVNLKPDAAAGKPVLNNLGPIDPKSNLKKWEHKLDNILLVADDPPPGNDGPGSVSLKKEKPNAQTVLDRSVYAVGLESTGYTVASNAAIEGGQTPASIPLNSNQEL